jgi:hypothetical protein
MRGIQTDNAGQESTVPLKKFMRFSFRVTFGSALFLWLALLGNADACLWLRGTTIDGRSVQTDKDRYLDRTAENLRGGMARLAGVRKLEIIEQRIESSDPVDRKSDAAVEILMDGDPAKAVTMLEELEKETPGRYYTAANLGTAYELSGDDEKALQWILEGIKRNPDSHMKTEWLHARILETKIKLKSDPAWLDRHTITGVDFSRLKEPGYKLETMQRPVDAKDLHRSLWTQLEVRTLFVKPQDPIVAQLLKELALVEAQVGILEEASAYQQMAVDYGMASTELQAQMEQWAGIIKWTNTKRKLLDTLYTAAVCLGLPLILFLVWKTLRIRRRKMAAIKAA